MRLRDRRTSPGDARSGSTLIEITIVAALFAVVLMASMAMIESGQRFSGSTIEITVVEDMAQQMLFKVEKELANASAVEPTTTLASPLAAGDTASVALTTSAGMPPAGILLVDRGTASEERLSYGVLDPDQTNLHTLERARQCSGNFQHEAGASAMWAAMAIVIAQQGNPPASNFDGITVEAGTQVFYQGDGSGFCFRVPVDPAGGNQVLGPNGLNWGAEVRGIGPTLDGRSALYFSPRDTYVESRTGDDLNRDGDTLDTFDVGQIRRISWDATNPTDTDDVGLGPAAILQERCNWGGDLDADGFDDPLFLWDPTSSQLHIRLFILGDAGEGMPIVRTVESVTFLRNDPEG